MARTASRPQLHWEMMLADTTQFTLGPAEAGPLPPYAELPQSRLNAGNLLGPLDDDSAWVTLECKNTVTTFQVGATAAGLGRRTPMQTAMAVGSFYDPDGDLDPANASSPYAKYLNLGQPVRLVARWPELEPDPSATVLLWRGIAETYTHEPGSGYSTIRARDFISRLARYDPPAGQVTNTEDVYARCQRILNEAQWEHGTNWNGGQNAWLMGPFSFAENAWTTLVKTVQNVHGFAYQDRLGRFSVKTPEDFWPLLGRPLGGDLVFSDEATRMLDQASVTSQSLQGMVNIVQYGRAGSVSGPDGTLTDDVLLSRFGAQRYERLDLYLWNQANRTTWAQELLDSANAIATGSGGLERLGVHPHRDPQGDFRDQVWDTLLVGEPGLYIEVNLPTCGVVAEGLVMGLVHTVTPTDWLIELVCTPAPDTSAVNPARSPDALEGVG